VFIGGAFALGLLGARFFKSSAREQEREWRGPSGEGSYASREYTRYAQQGSSFGNEVRGYAGGAGSPSYTSGDLSRVHDYQPATPDATGTPSVSNTSDTTEDADAIAGRSTATRARARRTTQSERS